MIVNVQNLSLMMDEKPLYLTQGPQKHPLFYQGWETYFTFHLTRVNETERIALPELLALIMMSSWGML
jgi:hypothetical protein